MSDRATAASASKTGESRLEGIEGWLIFPVLYLLIVAFACSEHLLESRLPALRPEILAANAGLLVGSVVLLVICFKRLALFPPLMIVFYVTVVSVCTLEYLTLTRFSEGIDPALVRAEIGPAREALGNALGAAILWIPYFLVSERVRQTFVR